MSREPDWFSYGLWGLAIAFGLSILACVGGANPNSQGVGDQPGGIKVGVGDMAVSPEGYVLFEQNGELVVGWPDNSSIEPLPVDDPTTLTFADGRPVVYVHSSADDKLHAIDVDEASTLWSADLQVPEDVQLERPKNVQATTYFSLESTPDDTRIIASWNKKLVVFETDNGGRMAAHSYDRSIVDARTLAESDRALLVHAETWSGGEEDEGDPTTNVSIVDLDKGEQTTVEVPNCASRLAINEQSRYAFIAPSRCERDPISVIDLKAGEESFVRNLPGFGPVQIAPKGQRAIGFLDADDVDASRFDDMSKVPPEPASDDPDKPRYYVMVIDTETLEFELHGYGNHTPRYTVTPDGRALLIDEPWIDEDDKNLRHLDTETGVLRDFEGPPITLQNFVVAGDSSHAYAISSSGEDGLFDLDIEAKTVRRMEVGFTPTNLNIGPDNETLYLRRTDDTICIYSIASEECTGEFFQEKGGGEVESGRENSS